MPLTLFRIALCLGSLLLLGHASAQAQDSLTCLSREEAERVAAWLRQERYFFSYCACCHQEVIDSAATNPDLGPPIFVAFLCPVQQVQILPCNQDAQRFAVYWQGKAQGFVMSEQGEPYAPFGDYPMELADTLDLREVWILRQPKPQTLADVFKDFVPAACLALQGFPSPSIYTKKRYRTWYARRQ